MSALVQYEPSVDVVLGRYLDQTQKLYASTGATVDFAKWLQFYAFDVIGQITYSKSHGFVDRAEDVEGMVGYLGWLFSYVAPVRSLSVCVSCSHIIDLKSFSQLAITLPFHAANNS